MSENNKIVGNCPVCGAPIYVIGEVLLKNNKPPKNVYSCDCRNKNKSEKKSSNNGMMKYGAK